MFILKELKLKNFRSWKELHLTDLDTRGLCLIKGINGSGKSSIRQAIEYSIVDKVSDGYAVADIPFNQGNNCEIYSKFIRGEDNAVIEITKYRNHSKRGDSILLEINGNDELTKTDRRLTQKEIERIFGISSDILYSSTIFQKDTLSFAEAKESDRKNILYDVKDLRKYDRYYDNTRERISKVTTGIDTAISSIGYLSKEIDSLYFSLSSNNSDTEKFETRKIDTIQELLLEKEKITVKDLSPIQEEVAVYEEKITIPDADMLDTLTTDYNIRQETYITTKADIQSMKKSIAETSNSTCPVFKESCDKLIERKTETEKKYNDKLKEMNTFLDTTAASLIDISDEINKEKEIIETNKRLEDTIKSLKNELKIQVKENELIETKRKNIDDKIKDINSQENPYVAKKTYIQDQIAEKEKERRKLNKMLLKLEDTLVYLNFYKIAFSKKGIPNLLIDEFLISLEDKTNEILSEISKQIVVQISSTTDDKEKIDYSIKSSKSKVTSYKSFSGGERHRIKVADIFAFNALLGRFNFIILDEVLESSLDDTGKSDIMRLLKTQLQNVSSIFVISHSDQIKQKFDNVIEVYNVNGESKLS